MVQQQQIDYQEALSRFDGAVTDSLLSWAPTAPIHVTDNDFLVLSPAV